MSIQGQSVRIHTLALYLLIETDLHQSESFPSVSANFNRLVEVQNRISLEKHQAYIGTVQRCLVDGESEDPRNNLNARTPGGRLVHVSGDPALVGRFVDVKIVDCSTWALFGELL